MAGPRWTMSPTSRSPRPRSAGSTSCGCGARESAIDGDLAAGRHVEVLGELDEWSRAHPLREQLHAQRMLALYRCGRQSEALAAFRDARAAGRPDRGRAGPGAAAPQRRDPRAGPRARRSARAARRRARARRRPRRLLAAAGPGARRRRSCSRVTALGGLGRAARIAENTVGLIDPGSGHITPQYPVGQAPERRGGRRLGVDRQRRRRNRLAHRPRPVSDDDRCRRRADRDRLRRRLAVGRRRPERAGRPGRLADEPRRAPAARGQRAARRGGRGRRGLAHLGGRRSGRPPRPRARRPDAADRCPRRARRHRRGRRGGVGGRRGGRRRDQARSPARARP